MTRVLLLLLVVAATTMAAAPPSQAPALSNPPSPTPNKPTGQPQGERAKQSKNTDRDERGAKDSPVVVEISKTPVIQTDTTNKTEKRHDYSAAEWWMVYVTCALSVITLLLALYTAKLYQATVRLGADAKNTADRQAGEMQKSLAIARQSAVAAEKGASAAKESADVAARSVMPFLFPYVIDMTRLHPLTMPPDSPTITHTARIAVAFDNYGKTPGMIKEVRADLFLTDRDILPRIDFENVRNFRHYQVIVPGDARGADTKTGALEIERSITFSRAELAELLSEATGQFRRFALIGRVIHDDFFGTRHTTRFCVKMRVWLDPNTTPPTIYPFQIAHGGSEYNRVTRENIPENDPFTGGNDTT